MNEPEVRNEILRHLYDAFFLSESNPDLKAMVEQRGWEETPFWNLIERMRLQGLVKSAALGGSYAIDVRGVLEAERTAIADKELVIANKNARITILLALAKVYEEKGNLHSVPNAELYERTGLERVQARANLLVLHNFYLAKPGGNGCTRLTSSGLYRVEEYRKGAGLADEFENISELKPQPRGRALQKLIARIVERDKWAQEEGLRTSNEEMDVIVFRDREYYLLESKWEKDPTEASVVRELFGKLSNRIGVRGIIVSMSGFTEGAVQQVHDYSGQRIILLFGGVDVRALVYNETTFEELLNAKYNALVTKRVVEYH